MEKNNKKIIAIVVPIAVVLLAAIITVLILLLAKPKNPCAKGHSYQITKIDLDQHGEVCSVCGHVGEVDGHEFSYELVDNQKHKVACSVCDLDEAVDHTFVYDQHTDIKHRVSCSVCNLLDIEADHVYDDAQDGFCNNCDYIRFAPSEVSITSSKTDLHPGDTFTVTVVISSRRKDFVWSAIDLTLGPLNVMGDRPSTSISPSFELVDISTGLEDYVSQDLIIDSSTEFFEGTKYATRQGVCIVIANNGADISCSQDLTITIQLRVKDEAASVDSFQFGIAAARSNYLEYYDAQGNVLRDRLDQATIEGNVETKNAHCVKANTIAMSIS